MTKERIKKLRTEKSKLDNSIVKLTLFVMGEAFIALDDYQRGRLQQQRNVMTSYSEILRDRIVDEVRRNET